MAEDNVLRSYGDVSRKEDVVLNAIEILTATETQIFNMLGKTTAIDTVHSYLVDTLKTAGSSAVAESGDYTMGARTTPTRLTNLVENVAIPFAVTRTQQLVAHYHGEDELTRQVNKALKEWANDAEFDLIRSTLVSGVSGTVPKLSGIIEATSKSTNHTSHTSGTVWSASILNGLMRSNWDNSNGDTATDLFMGSYLRSITDTFTQKTNNYGIVGTPSTISTGVTKFETSEGMVTIRTHRYVQQATDATARVLAINPTKLKVAFLERPYVDTGLGRSGDYDKRAIAGKFTLETHNQDSNFFADGFLKA